MLILAAIENLAAQSRRPPASRSVRFAPYKLLVVIRRTTGNHGYQLFEGGLKRLQPTVIRITRYGAQRRRQQFARVNRWPELAARSGRSGRIALVVPAWFYRGILDRLLVPLSHGGKHRSDTAHPQEREP
jgi:plasmid replication initiation protein